MYDHDTRPDRHLSIHLDYCQYIYSHRINSHKSTTLLHYADDPGTAQRERDSYYRGMGRDAGGRGKGEGA